MLLTVFQAPRVCSGCPELSTVQGKKRNIKERGERKVKSFCFTVALLIWHWLSFSAINNMTFVCAILLSVSQLILI